MMNQFDRKTSINFIFKLALVLANKISPFDQVNEMILLTSKKMNDATFLSTAPLHENNSY